MLEYTKNMTACEDMAANVAEAVKQLSEDDCVVIHCFDNIAFMARSEEGGICPSVSSHQETTTSKATLSWRARKGSTCTSKTARQYSTVGEVHSILPITHAKVPVHGLLLPRGPRPQHQGGRIRGQPLAQPR